MCAMPGHVPNLLLVPNCVQTVSASLEYCFVPTRLVSIDESHETLAVGVHWLACWKLPKCCRSVAGPAEVPTVPALLLPCKVVCGSDPWWLGLLLWLCKGGIGLWQQGRMCNGKHQGMGQSRCNWVVCGVFWFCGGGSELLGWWEGGGWPRSWLWVWHGVPWSYLKKKGGAATGNNFSQKSHEPGAVCSIFVLFAKFYCCCASPHRVRPRIDWQVGICMQLPTTQLRSRRLLLTRGKLPRTRCRCFRAWRVAARCAGWPPPVAALPAEGVPRGIGCSVPVLW